MSTTFQKRPNRYVVGSNRPRYHVNRPRGWRDVAAVYYVDRPPTSPPTTPLKRSDHIPPTTLGGQHRAPQGLSTWDGETTEERIERLRRQHYEMGEPFDEGRARRMMTLFDPDNAPDAEPSIVEPDGRFECVHADCSSVWAREAQRTQGTQGTSPPSNDERTNWKSSKPQ